jgi:hypothetical protein
MLTLSLVVFGPPPFSPHREAGYLLSFCSHSLLITSVDA